MLLKDVLTYLLKLSVCVCVCVTVADADIGAYNCTMKLANGDTLQHVVNLNGKTLVTGSDSIQLPVLYNNTTDHIHIADSGPCMGRLG